jgi:hypothetical protein
MIGERKSAVPFPPNMCALLPDERRDQSFELTQFGSASV